MSTRSAQRVAALAGFMGRFWTPQRTYEIANEEEFLRGGDTPSEIVFKFAGWRMLPCRLSTKLLELSMRLDPEHWDHWALSHCTCDDTKVCPDCGGIIDEEIE